MKKIGRYLWKAWEWFLFGILLPLSILGWWIVPPFGGSIWGRVIAAFMTFWCIFLYTHLYKRWKENKA